MPNKMLIDASHQEETRVVVVRGSRIEEFDFESQDKKQLKGNIYLARVTRVEPSLQAAFVEYGGNRHGFLAFSEIHPDYYQIPVADRQALIRAEAEEAEAENDDDEERSSEKRSKRRRRGRDRGRSDVAAGEAGTTENDEEGDNSASEDDSDDHGSDASDSSNEESNNDGDNDGEQVEPANPAVMAEMAASDTISEAVAKDADNDEANGSDQADGDVESVGADDALEEVQSRRKPMRRNYKIQEVVKRRQILLVQVVKEERGNKGAALTTYLSLAGRYSVLMPNTARGGGISRKITNIQDRKRLKDMVKELDVPTGMGVILRTAGESRTKAEIKRDYEYLVRLWENVRTLTLQSSAPALVYEEGSLIKRSVRDLYNKDIDEVLVAGDDGYREAKDFMRMLMPSHAKSVQPYRENVPLFARFGVESQLDRMLQPQVTLKSGGYIIINQTEALVAIDVNSGRSTKEHSIEDTALQTNLEAADEVARQLRLRDMAGLIVIDFIDMEENRNNRAVEKRMKDCLKNDRARIQVGRISHFGLLEMSRQRIRASVLESTMQPCAHCGGTGHIRSDSSVALLVLRAIEEALLKDNRHHITVKTPYNTALYMLNHKRRNLADLEVQFGLDITVEADDSLGVQHYSIIKGAVSERPAMITEMPILPPEPDEDELADEAAAAAAEAEDATETQAESPRQHGRDANGSEDEGEDGQRKKRRRRRRRGGRGRGDSSAHDAHSNGNGADQSANNGQDDETASNDEGDGSDSARVTAVAQTGSDDAPRKRRRGKRGGKRNRSDNTSGEAGDGGQSPTVEATADAGVPADTVVAEPVQAEAVAEEAPSKPKRTRKPAAKKAKAKDAPSEAAVDVAPVAEEAADDAPAKPKRVRKTPVKKAAAAVVEAVTSVIDAEPAKSKAPPVTEEEPAAAEQDNAPRKSGWWQRKSFF